jgi:hypothetical protein
MKQQKNSIVLVSALILLAALSRMLPHPPNFTPIGAIALFGAAHFDRKAWALLVPFVAFWVSDLILNNVFLSAYYEGFVWLTDSFMWSVAAFALIALLGSRLLVSTKPLRLLASSLVASSVFFLVTNFGVWATGAMYAKDFSGLMTAYAMGVPFFWNTVAGDLFFVAVLFGVYEFYKSYTTNRVMA